MTGTDVARFTHKQSRSYLNHLVYRHTITRYIKLYIYHAGFSNRYKYIKIPNKRGHFSKFCAHYTVAAYVCVIRHVV